MEGIVAVKATFLSTSHSFFNACSGGIGIALLTP